VGRVEGREGIGLRGWQRRAVLACESQRKAWRPDEQVPRGARAAGVELALGRRGTRLDGTQRMGRRSCATWTVGRRGVRRRRCRRGAAASPRIPVGALQASPPRAHGLRRDGAPGSAGQPTDAPALHGLDAASGIASVADRAAAARQRAPARRRRSRPQTGDVVFRRHAGGRAPKSRPGRARYPHLEARGQRDVSSPSLRKSTSVAGHAAGQRSPSSLGGRRCGAPHRSRNPRLPSIRASSIDT
jgi:hypothetical protein